MPRGGRLPISASRLAAATAGLSRELLEATLDLVPTPVVLVEPGTGIVGFANRAADELAGGAFPFGAAEDVLPGFRADARRIEGMQVAWATPSGPRTLLVSSDTIAGLEEREDLVVVAFEDVTQLKQAMTEAQEASALLDTLLEGAPVGVAVFGRDLRYRRVNAALAAINGIPAEQHVGRRADELLPAVSGVEGALRRVLETGEPLRDLEVRGETPARPGVERTWIVGYYPVRHRDGEIVGLGATVTDISERVELLASERAARARAEAAERRASFLSRASEVLGQSLDLDATMRAVAAIAVPEIGDWCVIDLVGADGRIERAAIAHADPERAERGWELARRHPVDPAGGEPTAIVIRTGEPLMLPEVSDDVLRMAARDDDHLRTLRDVGFASAIAAPLVAHGRTLGAVLFAAAESGRRITDRLDVELATELARRVAASVENARLFTERSHIARTLQRSLLPPSLPAIPGFDLAARYRAAGEGNDVGGDFYDVFQRTDHSWVVVLGDVCGKGPEAAAVTALARSTIRGAAIADGAPSHLLGALNATILREQGPSTFMTAVSCCLTLDEDPPVLHVGAGGHPPALVVRRGGDARYLRHTGQALGVRADANLAQDEIVLEAGDAVLLYTDGVLDAGAPARPLRFEELAEVARAAAPHGAERLVSAVQEAALERATGAPRDDIAIVAIVRAI
jgi:PAS domain S-box-containing protein